MLDPLAMDAVPRPAPTSARPRRARAQRGFALILVMILCMMMLVVVSELAFQANYELMAANNVTDLVQIDYAIDGQLEVVLAQLRFDKRQSDVDSEYDEWNSDEVRSRKDGDVGLTTHVYDEQGKLNLVRLATGTDPQKARAREMLVRILDMFREGSVESDKTKGGDIDIGDAEDIADRIVRHLKREGASGQVPKPKTSPDGVPLLLDELLFVDTKDSRLLATLLYDVQTKDKVAPGLQRYVTVYGALSDLKVNLNTAPLVVLKAQFSSIQDRDYAQRIIDRRRSSPDASAPTSGMTTTTPPRTSSTDDERTVGNPFTDVAQLKDGSVEGLTDEVLQRNGIDPATEFTVKSDFFTIRIQGATERTQRDELYVIERVKTDGFRFLLHQERTDPVLDTGDETLTTSGS